MPSSTFDYVVTIDAPPEKVWDGLQDPEVWSSIGPVQNLWDPVVEDACAVPSKHHLLWTPQHIVPDERAYVTRRCLAFEDMIYQIDDVGRGYGTVAVYIAIGGTGLGRDITPKDVANQVDDIR